MAVVADLKVGSKVVGHNTSIFGTPIKGKLGTIEDDNTILGGYVVTWEDTTQNIVDTKNLTLQPTFKVGDRVKITGKTIYDADCIGAIGTINHYGDDDYIVVRLDNVTNNLQTIYLTKDNIEFYTDPKPVTKFAHILTEKVVINDIKCRKILTFENMLEWKSLPKEYIDSVPSFSVYENAYGHFEFDGINHKWCSMSDKISRKGLCIDFENTPDFNLADGNVFIFTTGDIWEESVYQVILKELRAAGTNLASINKRLKKEKAEKDLITSWSGSQTDEI